MALTKNNLARTAAFGIALAAIAAISFRAVFASGPVLKNVNPQGTVTSSSVKITLETGDLARCRYSTSDTGYESMGNDMYTPDGLYHSGNIGTLNDGSYTYYVRCKDFEGNANDASAVVSFKVGDIDCVGSNCSSTPPVTPPAGGAAPVISGASPTGTVTSKYVTLAVNTDKSASCRYSWYDKPYEQMTLALTSNNGLYHAASATLGNAGNYNYYVRCKDSAGNINSPAGKISFYYYVYVAPKTTTVATTPVAPADTVPPTISGLSPSGTVTAKEVSLALDTDETATCRYGKSDVDYELMPESFGDAGTRHSKTITVEAPGEYGYYVRCIDAAKNKNTTSGQINFTYSLPEGPKVSSLEPSGGVVYQSSVALIATTDKSASCRFAESDTGYDQMGDFFDTSDGLFHQAFVDLPDYGSYSYYVRCTDEDGVSGNRAETISFEYQNPNPEAEPEVVEPEPVVCEQIQIGNKNGECDPTTDCVCDPDCPVEGQDTDPDCAGVSQTSGGGGGGWAILLLIGLILLIIIVIIIIIVRRKSAEEEDVELP